MTEAIHDTDERIRNPQIITPATDAEIDSIRNTYDDLYINSSSHSSSNTVFHIPASVDNTPLCTAHTNHSKQASELVRKPQDVYPRGWHDWCLLCVQVWREEIDE